MFTKLQRSRINMVRRRPPKDPQTEVSIVDLYERLVGGRLKKTGRAFQGLCCFHEEKHPSLALYPDTNSFYCFSCGASGNPVKFIMLLQNVSFSQAIQFLKTYR